MMQIYLKGVILADVDVLGADEVGAHVQDELPDLLRRREGEGGGRGGHAGALGRVGQGAALQLMRNQIQAVVYKTRAHRRQRK